MRIWLTLLLATSCAADADVAPERATGRLTYVTWNGGPCPRDYHCSGALTLADDTFDARFSDQAPVATGRLVSSAVTDIASLVAAIPADKPVGVLSGESDGPGIVELWISAGDELRVYLSNGFEGDLGLYLYDLRDAIEHCASGAPIASFTTCTP